MKHIYTLLFLISLFKALSQPFEVSSIHELRFVEGVDTVHARTISYWNMNDAQLKDSLTEGLLFDYKFKVYNSLGKALHNPKGVVNCLLKFEFKQAKYRCTFYEMVFTPMVRNRYGRFEEDRGKSRPLDPDQFKGTKTYEKLTRQVKFRIDQLLTEFDQFLDRKPALKQEDW